MESGQQIKKKKEKEENHEVENFALFSIQTSSWATKAVHLTHNSGPQPAKQGPLSYDTVLVVH